MPIRMFKGYLKIVFQAYAIYGESTLVNRLRERCILQILHRLSTLNQTQWLYCGLSYTTET